MTGISVPGSQSSACHLLTAAHLSEKEPLVRGVEEVLHVEFVIVSFVCQLDRAVGCPDIWPDIIGDISVRMFSEDSHI